MDKQPIFFCKGLYIFKSPKMFVSIVQQSDIGIVKMIVYRFKDYIIMSDIGNGENNISCGSKKL